MRHAAIRIGLGTMGCNDQSMCVQCIGTAAVAVGAASGIRAWLALRSPAWLTAGRTRALTAALLTVAVLASGLSVG
jgi:hypothetical protein